MISRSRFLSRCDHAGGLNTHPHTTITAYTLQTQISDHATITAFTFAPRSRKRASLDSARAACCRFWSGFGGRPYSFPDFRPHVLRNDARKAETRFNHSRFQLATARTSRSRTPRGTSQARTDLRHIPEPQSLGHQPSNALHSNGEGCQL